MNHTSLPALLLAAVISFAAGGCSKSEPSPSYLDPSMPVADRAADLVSRMTLEEKAQQVGHVAPAIPRLGVPEYNWWNEGLHGVARAGRATVFPQAIGMAASWDAPLMHEVADAISTEFRAKFVADRHPNGGSDWYKGLTVWSPNINIFRDPRWGRGQETYGEDPYLTGQIAVAFVRGLQGDDPDFLKTVATSKHYAVHSGPESNRHREDVHPSPHDLEDTYLPAFRATVVDAGVQSIMCAYNSVDGVPACANDRLMNRILREDWGFDGYVVSDCGAVANIFREDAHAYTDDPAEGVAMAFEAGMDIICGDYRNGMSTESGYIVDAVRRGLLDESVLDRSLQRLFAARIRLGLFDPDLPFADIGPDDYDTETSNALALRMARESLVLLKNEGNLLPLKSPPATIAVIGPNADSLEALLGNYNGTPSHPVTVLDGIAERFPESEVLYARGTDLASAAEPKIRDKAVAAAERANLVVFVAGLNAQLEGEEMEVEAPGFAGGDRTRIDLPAPQRELLERLQRTGKPVVLVLLSGSAIAVNWADEHLPAIVQGWYPGGMGGRAVAQLLAGDFSPAGRLPVTFYRSVQSLPAFEDYSMARRTYRYFGGEVLYSFGFGLSFTQFAYGDPQLDHTQIQAGDTATVAVDVTNTGEMDGDEVVQLYVSRPCVDGAPIRSLAGFRRIHLSHGETGRVQFPLDSRALSVVDGDGVRRVGAGPVELWIGGGQPVSRPGVVRPPGVAVQLEIQGSAILDR